MDELISIVVPIYNVEKFLEKCIRSIIAQTYINLEIILVDDGSTDSCGMICDEYKKKDNRIKVIHKKNGGLSSARNKGIDIAKGKYIGFVDGDDWIEPQMYRVLYDLVKKDNADLGICGFLRIKEEEASVRVEEIHSKECISGRELLSRIIDYDTKYIVAWNKLYKCNLFKKLRYPKGKIHEDEFIIHDIAWNCKKVSIISDILYNYRIRDNSIMLSKMNIKKLDGFEAIYYRYLFLKKHELHEFIPLIIRNISRYYVYYINRISLETREEKERYEEIKQMALSTYNENKELCDLKTKMAFKFPYIFNIFLRVKSFVISNNDFS